MPTLEWIGKDKVINHHLDVPYQVLEEKYTFNKSGTSGNKIIKGDNLAALKSLLPEYEGKIKCIYIDPPYNTGNEKWCYNDNVNDPKIKKWLGEVVGKEGEDLSRHDKWLCMMYPRLKLLQKLLSDDGAIFISIDDNEQANLKIICDEIFGSMNYIGPIIQNKMNAKNDTLNVQKNHEFIIIYRKKIIYTDNNKIQPTLVNNIVKPKEVFQDESGYYYLNDSITTRGEGGVLNARTNLGYTIYYNPNTKDKVAISDYDKELAKTSNDLNEVYTTDINLISKGYVAIRPPKVRDKLGAWTWDINKFNNEKINLVITGGNKSYSVKKRTFVSKLDVYEENDKLFYVPSKSGNSKSIIDFSTNDGTLKLNEVMGVAEQFDNPKNVEMLSYLINLIPSKDAIILDSFAGSGTTAHAVLNLNKEDGGNRKFILVEMEDYAEKTTAERVKRVIKGYSSPKEVNETIYDKSITLKHLKNKKNEGFELIQEAEMAAQDAEGEYDKISKPRIKDGHLVVIGTNSAKEDIEGTGGDFTFYELGARLLDENGNLNETVSTEKIRNYIWYMETHTNLPAEKTPDSSYYLGTNRDTAYYFAYEKESSPTSTMTSSPR